MSEELKKCPMCGVEFYRNSFAVFYCMDCTEEQRLGQSRRHNQASNDMAWLYLMVGVLVVGALILYAFSQ
tara:strand:+ start:24 stop:233 length:210 start_codon:yes stop_codon:yes gene_type:complete